MLTILIIFIAVLLVLSCFAVRGKKEEIVQMEEFKSEDLNVMGQIFSAKGFQDHHIGIGIEDLKKGDTVHIVTATGSKYHFRLLDEEIALFYLKAIRKRGSPRVFEGDVALRTRFVKGCSVVFFTMDFTQFTTTKVMRILVA